jgi:hypothetical protein
MFILANKWIISSYLIDQMQNSCEKFSIDQQFDENDKRPKL